MVDEKIKFDDVRYCYGDVCAVQNVCFGINTGQLSALVGPNGGGKSTIIKLLTGTLKPDDGSIKIADNAAIGYVSQGFGFDISFPITVKEIVLTGTLQRKIKPFRRYSNKQKIKALEAIEKVGLAGYENRGVNQLSGGQLRRVVIARALASEAEILVLDEPDSNLDVEAARDLLLLLNELKKSKTILVASHNIDDILDIADSAVYVNKSTIEFDDPKSLLKKLNEGMVI